MSGVVHIAGAIFIAIDSLVTYTPINIWIRRRFRELAAPGVPKEDVEKAVPQISMRIVGMIHILIQVRNCCDAGMDVKPLGWLPGLSRVLGMLLQTCVARHALSCHSSHTSDFCDLPNASIQGGAGAAVRLMHPQPRRVSRACIDHHRDLCT